MYHYSKNYDDSLNGAGNAGSLSTSSFEPAETNAVFIKAARKNPGFAELIGHPFYQETMNNLSEVMGLPVEKYVQLTIDRARKENPDSSDWEVAKLEKQTYDNIAKKFAKGELDEEPQHLYNSLQKAGDRMGNAMERLMDYEDRIDEDENVFHNEPSSENAPKNYFHRPQEPVNFPTPIGGGNISDFNGINTTTQDNRNQSNQPDDYRSNFKQPYYGSQLERMIPEQAEYYYKYFGSPQTNLPVLETMKLSSTSSDNKTNYNQNRYKDKLSGSSNNSNLNLLSHNLINNNNKPSSNGYHRKNEKHFLNSSDKPSLDDYHTQKISTETNTNKIKPIRIDNTTSKIVTKHGTEIVVEKNMELTIAEKRKKEEFAEKFTRRYKSTEEKERSKNNTEKKVRSYENASLFNKMGATYRFNCFGVIFKPILGDLYWVTPSSGQKLLDREFKQFKKEISLSEYEKDEKKRSNFIKGVKEGYVIAYYKKDHSSPTHVGTVIEVNEAENYIVIHGKMSNGPEYRHKIKDFFLRPLSLDKIRIYVPKTVSPQKIYNNIMDYKNRPNYNKVYSSSKLENYKLPTGSSGKHPENPFDYWNGKWKNEIKF